MADDRPGEEPGDEPPAEGMPAPAARRRTSAGAMLGAAMLGIDIALGRKPREEVPVVVDANGDPVDVDTDGISVDIGDDAAAVAPALPRRPPTDAPHRRRRSRR